jgi:hypothetical protein
MSVTTFVREKEHAAKLRILRPPPPRAIGVPLLVPPRSNRYGLIGTAFDYLLRFDIKRRAPHAISKPWAAASSLERLFRQVKQADGSYRSLIPDDQLAPMALFVARDSIDDLGDYVSLGREKSIDAKGRAYEFEVGVPIARKPGETYHDSLAIAFRVGRRALKIIENARATYEKFIEQREVNREDQEALARCCIRLARVDVVLRAARVDPAMLQEPEPDDVAELIDLLGIVPFDSLLNQERLILNPTFGESSMRIGGADSDLISRDMLVDFKSTKEGSIAAPWLDQLLGYYLLCRNERTRDPGFPEIKRLGLYFVRHGFLWVRAASEWTNHPQFAEIEKWFLATALNRHNWKHASQPSASCNDEA